MGFGDFSCCFISPFPLTRKATQIRQLKQHDYELFKSRFRPNKRDRRY